jgi:p-hydroxybenzoate 3-monooxygenase
VYDKVVACLGITGMQNLTYDRQYPFAWLWILAKAAPIQDELVYANHANGFALYSMRSPEVTCL